MRDKDIRLAVITHLATLHKSDPATRIVEEMGIWAGTVRIDVAVINGELAGYELKSDQDTLDRLPMQADLYSRVFDQVTLVVGNRHIEKASSLVPNWWGLILAKDSSNGVELETIRGAVRNPAPEPYLVAELLWKDEAISVLGEFGLAKGWRAKRIKAVHNRLAEEVPFPILADRVRSALKRRPNWLGQNHSHQLNVTVDAQLDPVLQPLRG